MSWTERRARLGTLISAHGDEQEEGAAIDRLLHGQSVIGQTSRTKEVERLRFSDKDLNVIGTLERGQFGVIHLVSCKLDGRIYVRKSIEKVFAIRNRDHCSPMIERNILLHALQSTTPWSPHLFCAFQTSTHLNIMMDYAEGGSLQDVLESSPLAGRISEADMGWWAPQIVAALDWCHSHGFAHRDVKPNNFVLTATAHLQLIDFGSAAPLLPPEETGVRRLPKEHCLVPCGTCDYIAPEILLAHERALVRLEMETDSAEDTTNYHSRTQLELSEDEGEDAELENEGYGVEVDWWSVGVMLYEMAYGVTPFFADSVQTTYLRIMDHKTSLHFDKKTKVSGRLQDLLKCLLTKASHRLGRRGIQDIFEHEYFRSIRWDGLHQLNAPASLHKPEFAYETPIPAPDDDDTHTTVEHESVSAQPVQWSALFQSSSVSQAGQGLGSLVQNTPGFKAVLRTPSMLRSSPSVASEPPASFIGFSWGPRQDMQAITKESEMNDDVTPNIQNGHGHVLNTPRPIHRNNAPHATPMSTIRATAGRQVLATPRPLRSAYATPMRAWAATPGHGPAAHGTLLRSAVKSSGMGTAHRRTVTEREAMKQLIDCVGMSARKKVLASGRKPRILASELFRDGPLPGLGQGYGPGPGQSRSRSRSRSGSLSGVSALSFKLDSSGMSKTGSWGRMQGRRLSSSPGPSVRKELRFDETPQVTVSRSSRSSSSHGHGHGLRRLDTNLAVSGTDTETETETDLASVPPSPSPSPRPGSAMSIMSRRSGTPTGTLTGFGSASISTFGGSSLLRPPTAMSTFSNASGAEQSTRRSLSPSPVPSRSPSPLPSRSPSPSPQPAPALVRGPNVVESPSGSTSDRKAPSASRQSRRKTEPRRVADVTGYDDPQAETDLLWDEMAVRHHQLMSRLDSIQTRLSRLNVR